jgi:hypothetical protein
MHGDQFTDHSSMQNHLPRDRGNERGGNQNPSHGNHPPKDRLLLHGKSLMPKNRFSWEIMLAK